MLDYHHLIIKAPEIIASYTPFPPPLPPLDDHENVMLEKVGEGSSFEHVKSELEELARLA